MPPVLAALFPIFTLIGVGWAFRRWRFPGDEVWAPLNRLIYYVLFPALLLRNFATADLGAYAVAGIGAATVGSMLAMAGLMLLARPLLTRDGPAFTSLLQTSVRFNIYAGLAIAQGVYGPDGLTAFSLVVAFVIPTANLISVTGLAVFAGSGRLRLSVIAVELARNPLILGVLGGVLLSVSGIGIPGPLDPVLEIVGRAALPMALLAVGAGLDFRATRSAGGLVVAGTAIRLLGMPALVLAAAWLAGLDGMAATALLLYACLPDSPAAYVLARQMGGDAALMAALITATTLAAAVTIPLWLAVGG